MSAASKTMTPFHFWISLFPQAPLFGVEWQFARFFTGDVTPKPARASGHVAEQVKDKTAQMSVDAKPAPAVEAPAKPEPMIEQTQVAEEGVMPPAKLYDIAPIDADDLKALKGVGPKLEIMLNDMGIYRFEQIAAFTPANLAWVDENLTSFKGRPFREDWVLQAKNLL